ncbi:MAG: hypothetical protein LBJ00_00605, partial [Planctomycetaceae bacterium]|nr:hypothetical protein [Planctomycetaceae bacterium]
MSMKNIYYLCGIIFIGLCMITACKPANPYGTVSVTGTVTLDGVPTDGITVIFIPVSNNGMSASGLTDSKGKYVVTTGGAPFGTGAVPGEYNVVLSKLTNSEPQLTVDEYNALKASGKTPSGAMNQETHLIPEKYSQAKTSG